MKRKVLGLGNALVDIIFKIDEEVLNDFSLPKGSMTLVDSSKVKRILEETNNKHREIAAGGSASNTMDGLSNLGISSGYIGKIGDDEYGTLFRNEMKSHKIIPHLLKGEASTGTAITLLSHDAERTFATYLGAAVELTPSDLDSNVFKEYEYFHIEGYLVYNHELIITALKMAKKAKMIISIDMASFNVVDDNKEFLLSIIKDYVDIVFANEDEAKSLTRKAPSEAVEAISEWCDIAVVKVGKNGSWIKRKNEIIKINGVSAVALDSTGAGDIYASGFLYGLVAGLSLQTCGNIGSYLGARLIEVYGARLSNEQWSSARKYISEII